MTEIDFPDRPENLGEILSVDPVAREVYSASLAYANGYIDGQPPLLRGTIPTFAPVEFAEGMVALWSAEDGDPPTLFEGLSAYLTKIIG